MSQEKLKTLTFNVPKIDEQKKISKFIYELDKIITLHQCVYFVSFLFFEYRIKNKHSWKQRKVADIFKVTRGYVLAAPMTRQSADSIYKYPVYSSQTLNEGLMGYYNKFLFDSAIAWTTDGTNAGTVKYRNGQFYCTNVCGVLLSDVGLANKANAEALNNIAWKYVSKVGNPKLMNNVMSEI